MMTHDDGQTRSLIKEGTPTLTDGSIQYAEHDLAMSPKKGSISSRTD